MISFTVYQPPSPPPDRLDRAAALVFIRDKASLLAMLLGPVWLLVNGVWVALAGYVGLAAVLALAWAGTGLAGRWIFLVMLGVHVWIGLEAAGLRRWALVRRGWSLIGTVTGNSLQDCERRFYDSWLPDQPFLSAERIAPAATLATSSLAGSGLLGPARASSGWRGLPWKR